MIRRDSKVPQREPEQVLHYRFKGGPDGAAGDTADYFRQHRDALEDGGGKGGNRVVTVIVYLRTPRQGGETFFNQVKPVDPRP